MEIYRIGEIIREERIRKKVSQEELCFGICSPTTLSRIESGNQKPSLKVEEALLERLGHSTENLMIYADDSELKKHRLENEIRTRMMHWEEPDELLEEYRGLISTRGTEGTLERQFYLMAEAAQAFYKENWEWPRIRKQLSEALRITMPNFTTKQISEIKLLTGVELEILNNIALTYAKEQENKKAIQILEALVDFLSRGRLDTQSLGKYYPVFLFNLVKILEQEGDFSKIKRYSQSGIDYCIRNCRLSSLAEHLLYYGVACEKLGDKDTALTYYQRSKMLFEIQERRQAVAFAEKKIVGLGSSTNKG